MTTALEHAIEILSDPTVTLSDALRRLLVVARRIGADPLAEWIRNELNGYAPESAVPSYRREADLPIRLTFNGPMQSTHTVTLHRGDLPDELGGASEAPTLRQPAAELEKFAKLGNDPGFPLPVAWIQAYRHSAEKGHAPTIEMMILNHATVVVPRTYLHGIVDRIKSMALDLALSLEDVSPDVGSPGGPTVADSSRLAETVQVTLMQVYGDHATVTIGDQASVASGRKSTAVQIAQGDSDALLRAAAAYLDHEGIQDLADALAEDGDAPGEQTRTFLDKLKSGAYGLAGGITTNAAYDGLIQLFSLAFPNFTF